MQWNTNTNQNQISKHTIRSKSWSKPNQKQTKKPFFPQNKSNPFVQPIKKRRKQSNQYEKPWIWKSEINKKTAQIVKFSEQWSTYAFTEVAGIEVKLIEQRARKRERNCSSLVKLRFRKILERWINEKLKFNSKYKNIK